MEPLQFAAEVLDLHGAVVEPEGVDDRGGGGNGGGALGSFHALLPERLAAQLGWEEEIRLTAPEAGSSGARGIGHGAPEAGSSEARGIGYGSADLEKLLELLRGEASVVRLRAELPWPRTRNLAPEVSGAFRFRTKVRMTYLETRASHAGYLIAYYTLRATSEDTHESLVTAVINESTLAPVAELAQQFEDRSWLVARAQGGTTAGVHVPKGTCATLHREGTRAATRRLEPFVRRLERRRRRDAERLHRYYEAMAREVCDRKGRGRARAPATIEEKTKAIGIEYERKIRDLDHRYAVRITLRPVVLLRVDLPVLRGSYHLQWRRAERALSFVWNPLLHALEPMACDDCGRGDREMTIDERLRVRCPACAGEESRRRRSASGAHDQSSIR